MATENTKRMETVILPDTNILIYSIAGKEPYASVFKNWIRNKQLVFSVIVIAEFLIKSDQLESEKLNYLLSYFKTIPVDLEIAREAASIRKTYLKHKQKLLLPDCLIAAQCKLHDVSLATANPTDYPKKYITIISTSNHL